MIAAVARNRSNHATKQLRFHLKTKPSNPSGQCVMVAFSVAGITLFARFGDSDKSRKTQYAAKKSNRKRSQLSLQKIQHLLTLP
jgi:hypothetical protein